MRITGGTWRGRRLAVATGVRPSSAMLREALVSRWLPRLEGASVLDLYAGSGAVGLELLGRGAVRAVAVESQRAAAGRLAQVARAWPIPGLEVRRRPLPKAFDELEGLFDLIFADPPYDLLEDSLAAIRLLDGVETLLAADGEFALEVRSEIDLPERASGLERIARRGYGDSALAIYARPPGVNAQER